MRKLSDKFMNDLQNGVLNGFLKAVQDDDTLCLEIRNNYINIYYRGGNLCRVKTSRNNVGYGMTFDEKYAKTAATKKIIENISNWSIDEWVVNIPLLKAIIDKNNPPSVEKEFQQLISWENNRSRICNDTDYYIADIEYQIALNDGKKPVSPRIDMLGVKWLSTKSGRKNNKSLGLAFIEVKYGDSALKDVAGVVSHIKDWNRIINNEEKWSELRNDTLAVFNQKVRLGLVRDVSREIESVSDTSPELILLIANHKPMKSTFEAELRKACNSDEYRALCEYGCYLMIATASFMGYGLYVDCLKPISENLGGG
jgi:hypothetical protein